MSVRTEWRNVSFLKVEFSAVDDIFTPFSLCFGFMFCRFPCLCLLCFVVLFPCLWLLCFVEYFLVFVFYVFSFSFYLSFVFRRIFPCLWLSCFVVYFFVLGLVRPSLLLPHWIQCVISLSIKNSVLLPSFSFSSEEMGCQNKSSIIWIKRDFLQVLIKSLHSLLQEGFLHRGKILLLFLFINCQTWVSHHHHQCHPWWWWWWWW